MNFCNAEALFCDKCGTPLSASLLKQAVPENPKFYQDGPANFSQQLEEMRKHITVMFVDVRGATSLVSKS
jgi:class 3 adenylate cyclase